jgi:hypothetical protein
MVETIHEEEREEKKPLEGKGRGEQVLLSVRWFLGVYPRNSADLPLRRLDECGGEMTTGQYSS